MRLILALSLGILIGIGVATPAFPRDGDTNDPVGVCNAIQLVCLATCKAKHGTVDSINFILCASACDGERKTCTGSDEGGIMRADPKHKLPKHSVQKLSY